MNELHEKNRDRASLTPAALYAKKGLSHCYMAERQCWSYIYHLDGRDRPNESFPPQDAFYSLNVILGFAALGRSAWEGEYDLPALLQINARRVFEDKAPIYAIGMALWASAVLGSPFEPDTAAKIRAFVTDRAHWKKFRAQDLGMILTGMAAMKKAGNNEYAQEAHALFTFLKEGYISGSGLFRDAATGPRKYFASFATQTYLITACYHYGTAFESDEALTIADDAVRALLPLQGENGEWPWFYRACKRLVVDYYELYTVHQNAMAALFLRFAKERGVPGAHEALIKGFGWSLGGNRLGKNMMVPELGMFYRSVLRKGELKSKIKRLMRVLWLSFSGRADSLALPDHLDVRLECRSYELGWILYVFAGCEEDDDLAGILYHPAFTAALRDERSSLNSSAA